MKEILSALAQLPRLEALLALETCVEVGRTFDVGDSLAVRADDRGQVICASSDPDIVYAAVSRRAEMVSIKVCVPDPSLPGELAIALRLLGTTSRGEVRAGASIDVEDFEERVQALQHASCLMHFIDTHGIGPVEETAEALLSTARLYRVRRDAAFELDNTAFASQRARDAATEQLQKAVQAVALLCKRLGPNATIRLLPDPRGGALVLEATMAARSTSLAGLSLAWPLAAAPAPGERRAKSASRGASEAAPVVRSSTKVGREVVDALQSAVATGKTLVIGERLSPGTYSKVRTLLTTLGGRWDSSKQAHVFDRDAAQVMRDVVGGRVVTDRDWEFFPTPQAIVQRMMAKAQIRAGWRVREPSAGQGAIARALAAVVGAENVACTEAMPRNAQCLRDLGFKVHEGDFLLEPPEPVWDAICMNPPFSAHQDVEHITHALRFLRPGGRLVAIASPSWRTSGSSKAKAFRRLLEELDAQIESIPAGAFRTSGTDVATVMLVIEAPRQLQAVHPCLQDAPCIAQRSAGAQLELLL